MLSLRVIIGTLFLLLTFATAGTILAVFLSFTHKATDEIANSHVKSLATNTAQSIEGWMEGAVGEHTAFQRWLYQQDLPYPYQLRNGSSDYTYMKFMHEHLFGILSAAGYKREAGIVVGYADHTLTYTAAVAPTMMIQVTYTGHSTEPVGVYNQSLDDRIVDMHPFAGHQLKPLLRRSVTVPQGDPFTFPWWNNVNHSEPLAVSWDSQVRLAVGSSSIGCAYGLHTKGSYTATTFWGVMVDEIDIANVRDFLLEAERTENTHNFLLDNSDGIIATTYNVTLAVVLNVTEPDPANMVCQDSFVNAIDGRKKECRFPIHSFPWAPLQAAINTSETSDMLVVADSNVANSRRVKSEDGNYYVAVKQLRVSNGNGHVFPNLQWKVVYIMKESDITGPVTTGRNYSILAAVCLFLFFNLVAFVLLTLLLAPIRKVAEEMESASRLQDLEGEGAGSSVISEVAELQNAYQALKSQLSRIRSFVPSALLAQLDDETDDEEINVYADTEEKCNDNASERSTRSKRSTTQSQSSRRSGERSHAGSKRSSGSHEHHGIVGFEMALTKKRVAVTWIRLTGFRAMMGDSASDRKNAMEAHAELIAFVAARCKEVRGVLDHFQDDYIVVTFNLSIPSAQAARGAVSLALSVAAHCRQNPQGFVPYFGVAQGTVIAGTMGSKDVKRQCLVGAVYRQAEVLSVLAHKMDASILSPVKTLTETLTTKYQVADVVPLPGDGRCPIGIPQSAGTADDNLEWMYDLEEGEKNDPYRPGNQAVQALLGGKAEAAATYVQDAEKKPLPHRDFSLELIHRLMECEAPANYTAQHVDYLQFLS